MIKQFPIKENNQFMTTTITNFWNYLKRINFGRFAKQAAFKRHFLKGGTSFKKIDYPDYRFSEGLDFTLPGNNINNKQIFTRSK